MTINFLQIDYELDTGTTHSEIIVENIEGSKLGILISNNQSEIEKTLGRKVLCTTVTKFYDNGTHTVQYFSHIKPEMQASSVPQDNIPTYNPNITKLSRKKCF